MVACCRVSGAECSSVYMGHFEGGDQYLHYLHHSSASGQTTGREHRPATENWIKDLLSMAPSFRTRPSFPLSQSLPSGSFHKPLILLHQRAAAAAKSLQSCPTLCDPIDSSLPGVPAIPGIL